VSVGFIFFIPFENQLDVYIEYGNMRLDPAAHTLTQEGHSVILSSREFAILQTLLENVIIVKRHL